MSTKNSDNEEQFELIPLSKNILKFHGLWPKRVNKKYLAMIIPVLLSWQGFALGFWGHLFHHLKHSKITYTLIADDIAGIVSTSHAIYILVVYLSIKNQTDKMLLKLTDYRLYEKPNDIEKTSKFLDLLAKLFCIWIYFCLCFLWVANLLQKCEPDDTSDCGLIMDGYIPYVNVYKYPNRRIFMTVQLYGAFLSAVTCYYVSWLFLCMTEILVTYIKHFKSMLLQIPSIKGRPARKIHIKKCVLYHYHILDLYVGLMDGGRKIMLIHVACTAIIMSLLCYDLLETGFKFISVAHISIWCCASGVAGVFGERIIHESSTIPEAVYESVPWDGDYETGRDLLLISIRGARMLYLPASNFGALGHARLMAIAKASYSYLTLLANTNTEH